METFKDYTVGGLLLLLATAIAFAVLQALVGPGLGVAGVVIALAALVVYVRRERRSNRRYAPASAEASGEAAAEHDRRVAAVVARGEQVGARCYVRWSRQASPQREQVTKTGPSAPFWDNNPGSLPRVVEFPDGGIFGIDPPGPNLGQRGKRRYGGPRRLFEVRFSSTMNYSIGGFLQEELVLREIDAKGFYIDRNDRYYAIRPGTAYRIVGYSYAWPDMGGDDDVAWSGPPGVASGYGALAYSAQSQAWGWSYGFRDQEHAGKKASKACKGERPVIMARGFAMYLVRAVGEPDDPSMPRFSVGEGTSLETAKEQALHHPNAPRDARVDLVIDTTKGQIDGS